MKATPSLAITAARACLGQQIARAQRAAASDWDNKDDNQRLQTAIFLGAVASAERNSCGSEGENHHTSERAVLSERRRQSKTRALKVFSGPDLWSVALANVTEEC